MIDRRDVMAAGFAGAALSAIPALAVAPELKPFAADVTVVAPSRSE